MSVRRDGEVFMLCVGIALEVVFRGGGIFISHAVTAVFRWVQRTPSWVLKTQAPLISNLISKSPRPRAAGRDGWSPLAPDPS